MRVPMILILILNTMPRPPSQRVMPLLRRCPKLQKVQVNCACISVTRKSVSAVVAATWLTGKAGGGVPLRPFSKAGRADCRVGRKHSPPQRSGNLRTQFRSRFSVPREVRTTNSSLDVPSLGGFTLYPLLAGELCSR